LIGGKVKVGPLKITDIDPLMALHILHDRSTVAHVRMGVKLPA